MNYHEWVRFRVVTAIHRGDCEGAYYWTRICCALVA